MFVLQVTGLVDGSILIVHKCCRVSKQSSDTSPVARSIDTHDLSIYQCQVQTEKLYTLSDFVENLTFSRLTIRGILIC